MWESWPSTISQTSLYILLGKENRGLPKEVKHTTIKLNDLNSHVVSTFHG
jgi:tRNA(Leu) C34 or U34 (ribose-2'-O)-methylase TrmL